MNDPTEDIRREMVAEINAAAADRARLEDRYGQVWSTEQVRQDFEVLGFFAPFVRVIRKSDNERGMLEFQHDPRFYFMFTTD
jgi:hypothetical protein